MASIQNKPYRNRALDNKVKLIWLALYYGFARWLPESYSPLGKLLRSRQIRYIICKNIFLKCGKNVNIERGSNFGSGFEIEIGDNSGIGINCTCASNLKIGSNVLMGPQCFFLAFNHNFMDKSISIKEQGYSEKMVTTIGDDVWIGREALFTPGRTIADGTVIAARTCVCKDFPAYSVIGGNPSRLIKTRI
ncbi:acyltransferase [Macellibacteroides fermentans]|uniref:acyltransferase n=1 Tax=Macellibacteroides fermentans TaxID=879969 RepID=UPI003B93789E